MLQVKDYKTLVSVLPSMSECFFLKTCPSSLTPNSQSHQCISGPPPWQGPSTSKLVSCSPCRWRFQTDYPSAQSLAAIYSCAAGLSTGPELWNCTLAALRKSWMKRNLHRSRAVKLYTGYLEGKLEGKKFTSVQSCEIVHWLHWWKAARKEIYIGPKLWNCTLAALKKSWRKKKEIYTGPEMWNYKLAALWKSWRKTNLHPELWNCTLATLMKSCK